MRAYEKHGGRFTRLYRIWCGMKSRCLNIKCKDYKNYGAKGISFDNKWKMFGIFRLDMENEYYKHVGEYGVLNTTLERVDNKLGYSKTNCTWATKAEQSRNKSYGMEKRVRGENGKFISNKKSKDSMIYYPCKEVAS